MNHLTDMAILQGRYLLSPYNSIKQIKEKRLNNCIVFTELYLLVYIMAYIISILSTVHFLLSEKKEMKCFDEIIFIYILVRFLWYKNMNICTQRSFMYEEKLWLVHIISCFEPDIGMMVRVFANGPGDLGSISGQVLPKTQKMVLDASLLNTHHYKVQIKGSEQSRERSSTLLYTLV